MIQTGDIIQVINTQQKKNNYLVGRVGEVVYAPQVPSEGSAYRVRIHGKNGYAEIIKMLHKNVQQYKSFSNVRILH